MPGRGPMPGGGPVIMPGGGPIMPEGGGPIMPVGGGPLGLIIPGGGPVANICGFIAPFGDNMAYGGAG